MKKVLICFVLVLVALLYFRSIKSREGRVEFAETDVTGRWTQKEIGTYVLVNGNFYEDHGGGSYSFIQKYYDPEFYEKNYSTDGDAIYLCTPEDPGTRIRIRNEFKDDFESYSTVRDLMITRMNVADKVVVDDGVSLYDPDQLPTRWSGLTLQSPTAPKVKDLVALRKSILEGGGDFQDNRVEPSTERAHSGSQAIRFFSVARSRSMVCCKSSMSNNMLHYVKGDDFWFSGWFYFEKGMPTTIMDLESTWLAKHSGIRIQFSENGCPSIELKAFDKPIWRNREHSISRNQWVHVKVHFLLDEIDGKLELWIDGELVVEGIGQTLPLADTVYDSLELGISATNEETILFMDDIRVSKTDF